MKQEAKLDTLVLQTRPYFKGDWLICVNAKHIQWYIEEKEKLRTLRSIEPVSDERDKNKVCVNCGNISTQIAIFDVVGASQIERYCDNCVKSIKAKGEWSPIFISHKLQQ